MARLHGCSPTAVLDPVVLTIMATLLSSSRHIILVQGSPSADINSYRCQDSLDCDRLVGWGSTCTRGICSNPFAQGCFHRILAQQQQEGSEIYPMRVCNSQDPPDAVERGLCRSPDINYPEVRLFANNWESSIFGTWVLQILLSELLGVPTTVEIGTMESKQTNLYYEYPSFVFGKAIDNEEVALARARDFNGDCSLASHREDNYESCAHVDVEGWESDLEWHHEFVLNNTFEVPSPLGVLGTESWFVTKYTAVKDPTLVSYLGLQGEANRRKLAETFLRPTTWKEYCDEVNPTQCQLPDGVALRAPGDEAENDRMFVDGVYIGHFRKTAENDCDLYPNNCTGHIGNFPWHRLCTSVSH